MAGKRSFRMPTISPCRQPTALSVLQRRYPSPAAGSRPAHPAVFRSASWCPRGPAHGAFNLRMAGMTDKRIWHPSRTWRWASICTFVTSGQVASTAIMFRAAAFSTTDLATPCAEKTTGHLREPHRVPDKNSPLGGKAVNDKAVMNNLMPDIDRRQIFRAQPRQYGQPVNTSTESPWCRQSDDLFRAHHCHP